jgi:hypothetical protein
MATSTSASAKQQRQLLLASALQQQQQQQHVGGQQPHPEWSEEFGMLCREPELFDGRTLQWACVKCGAGAYWGAKGHNAADCEASDAEIEAWVHHGQAAP